MITYWCEPWYAENMYVVVAESGGRRSAMYLFGGDTPATEDLLSIIEDLTKLIFMNALGISPGLDSRDRSTMTLRTLC